MSLRIRFRFDGKCTIHPRYDPARDGKWEGCESLYGIHLYSRIAKRRADSANCGIARFSSGREPTDSGNKPGSISD